MEQSSSGDGFYVLWFYDPMDPMDCMILWSMVYGSR